MQPPEKPGNEEERVDALCGLEVLDTPAEERFDRLTRVARRHFGVAIALVSLVDAERQWFKSRQGVDAEETPREISFCGHAILGDAIFHVPDAQADPRFVDNPLVTDSPHIRFYAGAPVHAPSGERVGTFCIIDDQPRELSEADRGVLRDLADAAESELHREALHHSQQKLKAREEQLQSVLDTAADGIVIIDAAGIIRIFNPAAEAVFGYEAAEVLGRKVNMLMPESHAREHDGHLQHYLATGERRVIGQRREVEGRRKDGSRFPLEIAIRDMTLNGEPMFTGVVRDLSVQKEAERRQRESEQRYRAIVNTMAEGVALHGPDGAIIATNPAAEAILGQSEDQILGRDSTDPGWRAIRPDGAAFPGEEHPAMISLQTGRTVRDVVMGLQGASGESRWISINAEPIPGDAGPAGAVATFADITEQHLAKQALAEQEAHYRDLVENQTQFIERFLPDTTVLFANQALADALGVEREDLVGRRWIDLLPEEERESVLGELAKFTPRDPIRTFENSMTRADGEQRWVHWTNRAFFDDAGQVTHFQSVGIDLTERKATEGERDRLLRILEASPDFISMAEADGTPIYVNEGGRRLLGLPPADESAIPADVQQNEGAGEWAHPDWASRRIREHGIPAAMEAGSWEGETALIDAQGREIPVSQLILAHRDETGALTRLSTVMRDISRHKALEERLEQRQEALQRLQAATADPERTLEGKIEALLQLGADFFGLPYAILSQIEGEDYWIRQAVSPGAVLSGGQHFELGVTYCTHTLAAGGPTGFAHVGESAIADHPCYRTQGMEAYLGTPIRVDGEVYGTLNFSAPEARDDYSDFEWGLLELMGQWVSGALTQAAYRRRLEQERDLFIAGPTVMFVWRYEPGWPVTYVSPNLAENFGHEPADLRGQPFADLVHPDDLERVGQEITDSLERGVASFAAEYRLRTADGHFRWVYDFTVPHRDEHGVVEALHGYLLDRTDERRLRGALENSNAELEQFAYAISHDLKEPLRSVSGYLSLLRRRFGDQLPDKAAGYVAAAEEGGSRMGRMIEDLLQYSRIKRMGDEFAPVALDEVLEEALANLTGARKQTGATIEADPLPTVVGDRGQLVRLFQNLLSNALKYRRAEEAPVISIHLEEVEGAWQVAVADNGIGIDPDQADRVFQVFQRLHSREAYEGTGAGMALAQRIVQRHGGSIRVDSAGEGCGSTFRFTLPQRVGEA